MKIAVVGAAGMLGAVTVREWRGQGHDVTALTRAELDVTNAQQVRDVLGALAPDVVINCTAYNRVDDAEEEPATALAVNTWAVKAMARAAAAGGAVFVHYSTDFVYDGETDRPYTEHDAPNPQSAYGISKLLGEWFAREAGRHYVLRVESLFGGNASRSTVDSMLHKFATGQPVRAFTDRTVSPSRVDDVARATRELVERRAPGGLYHCVNTGMATWLEVAERLREWSGHAQAEVTPVRAAEFELKARRPRFAALSNAKLVAESIPMPTWQDALRAHLRRGLLALVVLAAAAACDNPEAEAIRKTTEATYDPATGRLTRITADLSKNGVIDTWLYMDGTKVLRTESDLDEDGTIDRWEQNFPDGRVERVGVSMRKTGKPDMWMYPDPASPLQPLRKEFVALNDATRIVRTEVYEAGRLVRVEEDVDEDGRLDRWALNDGQTVLSAEFDRNGDGRPDERVIYDATGKVVRRESIR